MFSAELTVVPLAHKSGVSSIISERAWIVMEPIRRNIISV